MVMEEGCLRLSTRAIIGELSYLHFTQGFGSVARLSFARFTGRYTYSLPLKLHDFFTLASKPQDE